MRDITTKIQTRQGRELYLSIYIYYMHSVEEKAKAKAKATATEIGDHQQGGRKKAYRQTVKKKYCRANETRTKTKEIDTEGDKKSRFFNTSKA